MDRQKTTKLQDSYDRVAEEYVRRIYDELQHKLLDRQLLDRLAAFYSIIHIPRDEVVSALRELKRVLRPDGLLLLAFHIGEDIVHLDELWEQRVSMDFVFFTSKEMEGYLRSAGFEIEEVIERDPYPSVEHQSRRAYIFARKSGAASMA